MFPTYLKITPHILTSMSQFNQHKFGTIQGLGQKCRRKSNTDLQCELNILNYLSSKFIIRVSCSFYIICFYVDIITGYRVKIEVMVQTSHDRGHVAFSNSFKRKYLYQVLHKIYKFLFKFLNVPSLQLFSLSCTRLNSTCFVFFFNLKR